MEWPLAWTPGSVCPWAISPDGLIFESAPPQNLGRNYNQQDAYDKLGQLPNHCRQPFRRPKTLEACAAVGLGIDELVEQRLALDALVRGKLSGHHVIPGRVQKRYLPASVGFGEQ